MGPSQDVDDPPRGMEEEVAAWAGTNRCDLVPTEQTVGDGVLRRGYPCEQGAIVVYTHPGGHIWPDEGDGLDANTVIWEFLQQ